MVYKNDNIRADHDRAQSRRVEGVPAACRWREVARGAGGLVECLAPQLFDHPQSRQRGQEPRIRKKRGGPPRRGTDAKRAEPVPSRIPPLSAISKGMRVTVRAPAAAIGRRSHKAANYFV